MIPCFVCNRDVKHADIPVIWPAKKAPGRVVLCSIECLNNASKVPMTEVDHHVTSEGDRPECS